MSTHMLSQQVGPHFRHQVDYFKKQFSMIMERFEEYELKTDQPEHDRICELFLLYHEAMEWFYNHSHENDEAALNQWSRQLDLCGVLAFQIYLRLKSHGIHVKYDADLFRNRLADCGFGPERQEFHSHNHSIEDLLNFCVLGTANSQEIWEMRRNYAGT